MTSAPPTTISRDTPLVVDGIMYVNAGSRLFAVDAATGRLLWNVQVEPAFPRAAAARMATAASTPTG